MIGEFRTFIDRGQRKVDFGIQSADDDEAMRGSAVIPDLNHGFPLIYLVYRV